MPKLTLRDLFAVVTIVEVQDQQIIIETSPGTVVSISFANAAIIGAAVGLLLVGGVVVLLLVISSLRKRDQPHSK